MSDRLDKPNIEKSSKKNRVRKTSKKYRARKSLKVSNDNDECEISPLDMRLDDVINKNKLHKRIKTKAELDNDLDEYFYS
jgi:hypothetical protein